jgi:O-antigen/teichoic acid export membrane protein
MGGILPLVPAIIATPYLLRGLGIERFGFLALAWALVGYLTLFDFGVGRSLTRTISECLDSGREDEIPAIAGNGLAVAGLFGTAAAVVLAAITPWLAPTVLKVPPALEAEAVRGLLLLALVVPLLIGTTAFQGVLIAYQRFGTINAIQIPTGFLITLGPLFAVQFTHDVSVMIAIIAFVRLVAAVAQGFVCLKILPSLVRSIGLDARTLRPLLIFGGWITVSNVIGPLMTYLDRFMVAAIASLAAVAYYTVPYDLVIKLTLVAGAINAVLFPAFSAAVLHNTARAVSLFSHSMNYLIIALIPPVLVVATLARPGLTLWLGEEFSLNAAAILQWLVVGVFINCIAQMSFALIQATGRADITAKLHLIELPLYLAAAWWLIGAYGALGAAIAWTLRVTADTATLLVLTGIVVPTARPALIRTAIIGAIVSAVAVAGIVMPDTVSGLGYLAVALSVFVPISWYALLETADRDFFLNKLRTIRALQR